MKISNSLTTIKAALLIVSLVHFSLLIAAAADTEDYYLCAHLDEGNWGEFGRIPRACDIDPFGSPDFVANKLAPSIFDDNLDRTSETSRYMNNMNAIIQQAAEYYFSARKPTASVDEIAAWQQAIATVANVETYWSHYRHATDDRLKMVRGDSGHGHGMMQIDDRWHFTAIEDGVGWQLFENILYSFEIFYAAWQDAVNQTCLDSETNWIDRSRSAYSAYNGGATRICRWSNEPGQWVQDSNFLSLYNEKPWADEISEPDLTSPLDVACFLEGEDDCIPLVDNSPQADWHYQLLTLSDGKNCLFYGANFHCIEQAQDVVCLNVLLDYVSRDSTLALNEDDSNLFETLFYERHQCLTHIENSYKVAETIRSVQNITLRTTPGGASTGSSTLAGSYYQILDMMVSGQYNQHRYYKIKVGSRYGYIYAGDKTDYMDWVTVSDHSNLTEILIPFTGDTIKVTIANGLVLRETTDPDSTALTTIPLNTEISIDSMDVRHTDNSIYYQLTYENIQGWAYGGHLLPASTLTDWATLVAMTQPPQPPTPKPSSGGGGSMPFIMIVMLLFYLQSKAFSASSLSLKGRVSSFMI